MYVSDIEFCVCSGIRNHYSWVFLHVKVVDYVMLLIKVNVCVFFCALICGDVR
jgi:hypothetical protein